MANQFSNFKKEKDFLICVDSDGCAMDTMDIKHFRCFGPCMVEEWQLQPWQEQILTRWNDINLYTMTRGINRFLGLAMALSEINESLCPIDGIAVFKNWAENAKELSNTALKNMINQNSNPIFQKALCWSEAVNESITQIAPKEKKAFAGVKDALIYAHQFADIAIVSSANLQAVLEEWEAEELLPYVDIVLAQDAGSKAYCLRELAKKGYEKNHILMTGDAPGDLKAAEKNEVFFYPILVKKEVNSWLEFKETAVDLFIQGTYIGNYQTKKKAEFWGNLS